jgi:hypothetical protein
MDRAVIVKGRLTNATRVELDEPVEGLSGAVEVVLRALPPPTGASHGPEGHTEDVLDFLARIAPGRRTKDEIDRRVDKERDAWEEA